MIRDEGLYQLSRVYDNFFAVQRHPKKATDFAESLTIIKKALLWWIYAAYHAAVVIGRIMGLACLSARLSVRPSQLENTEA